MNFSTIFHYSNFIKNQIHEKIKEKKPTKKQSKLLKNKIFGKKTIMKTTFAFILKTKLKNTPLYNYLWKIKTFILSVAFLLVFMTAHKNINSCKA